MNNIFLKDNPDITYPFPFSLNKENLNELLKFYSSQQTLCLLQGESGSFKTELLTHSLNYLNESVLLFRFKCFEGTTLDDIFLSFFEDLKKYSQQKKISFTKIETNSLSKRINTYLNHITLPGVIIIDSLENIFIKKNTAEKDEIISFIKHLKSMNKFKIILISSVFDTSARDDLESYVSIQIPEFNKEQVKQYFEHYSINIDSDILDNFFNDEGNGDNNAWFDFLKGFKNIIITKTFIKFHRRVHRHARKIHVNIHFCPWLRLDRDLRSRQTHWIVTSRIIRIRFVANVIDVIGMDRIAFRILARVATRTLPFYRKRNDLC